MAGEPTIILLAAGRSTRMRGADKMLEPVPAPLGDRPLLEVMAQRCLKAGPTRIVLGPDQDARRACVEGSSAEILIAPRAAGMAASIVTGVAGLSGAVLVVLADMPEVMASDLHLMLALGRHDPSAILRAASGDGTPGHPVLFPADLVEELSGLSGDEGARSILTRHRDRVRLVPLEGNRALTDLDTPEDWADWRAGQREG